MKRKVNKTPGLRGMTHERALAHCATITAGEWATLDEPDTLELWTVFRDYILNDYEDTGHPVPARVTDVWERCKAIIDGEVAK